MERLSGLRLPTQLVIFSDQLAMIWLVNPPFLARLISFIGHSLVHMFRIKSPSDVFVRTNMYVFLPSGSMLRHRCGLAEIQVRLAGKIRSHEITKFPHRHGCALCKKICISVKICHRLTFDGLHGGLCECSTYSRWVLLKVSGPKNALVVDSDVGFTRKIRSQAPGSETGY